ncbi:hypothetical protein GCM10025868_13730 [Angustibacter aerolatus]|uniref:Uncharacterized protein n=1 Tax=Angustibacter aerolatus TaxID=1162965 RepID=A0ABQ6JD59_9ACTN|nr:hypothetical protein GCM10025868_13730 [Angustibacter aerolatus]
MAAGPPVSRRHCWVLGPPDAPGRWPGLLVEWARTGDVWRGRVVYVVDDEGQAVLVESWVPSRQARTALTRARLPVAGAPSERRARPSNGAGADFTWRAGPRVSGGGR